MDDSRDENIDAELNIDSEGEDEFEEGEEGI